MYYQTYYQSPLGQILLVSNEKSLVGLWLEDQKYYLGKIDKELIQNGEPAILKQAKQWLDRYFNQAQPALSELSLAPMGTPFQHDVWKILCNIPYGQTMTYGEIAAQIAIKMNKKSMSAQAVGNAVGHNPISIIIPCHRVVGSNGNLTGYAGGIEKKIKLLQLEHVDLTHFFIP